MIKHSAPQDITLTVKDLVDFLSRIDIHLEGTGSGVRLIGSNGNNGEESKINKDPLKGTPPEVSI